MKLSLSACSLLALSVVAVAVLPMPAHAEIASDAACADAVDFAMRTAERRDAGKTRDEIAQSVHEELPVFRQQYPDLEEGDMQDLVTKVFAARWTRFNAAKATARDCVRHLPANGPVTRLMPDLLPITGARS